MASFARQALPVLLVCAGYYLGALLGKLLRFPHSHLALIWPPTAIALATLLLTPRRKWWVYILALGPTHILVQAQDGVPLWGVFSQLLGNFGQALTAAVCVRHFTKDAPPFGNFRSVVMFIVWGALFAPFAVSTIVTNLYVLSGWEQSYWYAWRARVLSNVLSTLAIVPPIVLIAREMGASRNANPRRFIEMGLIGAGLILIGVAALRTHTPVAFLLYAPLPFVLWTAVRFGIGELCLSMLTTACLFFLDASGGQGQFVTQSPAENVLSLQLYLIAISIPLMLLAALTKEREDREEALRESEQRYRSIVERQTDLVCRFLPDTTLTFVNEAYARCFGKSSAELIGQSFLTFIPPDNHSSARKHLESLCRNPRVGSFEHKVLVADGDIRWQHWVDQPIFADDGSVVEFQGVGRDITDRKRAEEALRDTEESLARTEKFSLVMATHTDLEGRWLKVPPTLCKLLDYTEEELLGRRFHEFTHPDDAEADWNQCSRLIRGEIKSFDLEKRYIRKDGSIVWVYLNVSVVMDANGAPVHFRTYIRDISQRKQREQALRQSEERYRTLAETATDIILTIDQTGRILFVNAAVEKVFGYTPAEIVGQKITALMPERMRDRHEEAMRHYLETGEKRISWSAVSFPGLHKNGREISLDVSFAEVRTGDERFFSGIMRDVTERKRTEEALRASDERLRLALEAGRMGVWDWDRRNNTLNWSKEYFTILGLVPFSVEPTYRTWASRVHPEDFRRAEAAMDAAIAEREDYQCEYRVSLSDGAIRWVEARGTPIYDNNNKCIGVRGLIVDITERKRSEEALRDALAKLQQLKVRVEADNVYLREELSQTHRSGELLGRSAAMRKVLRQIEQVAATDMTVLVLGETGTGKELVARALHAQGTRKHRPLVKVNCSALPAELIESELFGHEKGAFTGATARQVGRFDLADGGTIFLDEIGDLPLNLQVKLLRVLQEGEFERLGSGKTIRVNVRVIAATNRDLVQALSNETFRADLYYRLNVYPIALPPLRERREDIELLAQTFLTEAGQRLGRSFEKIPHAIVEALQNYDWPGNVRELQNVIERAAVISKGGTLELPEEWKPPLRVEDRFVELERPTARNEATHATLPKGRLEDLERAHIIQVLLETRWRIEGPKGAAVVLGLNPSTLRSRMQKLGISRATSN